MIEAAHSRSFALPSLSSRPLPPHSQLAIDINDEVQDQNRLLDGMDGQMGSAGDMMSETIGKLGTMLNSPDGKHMMYVRAWAAFSPI